LVFAAVLVTLRPQSIYGGIPGYIHHPGEQAALGGVVLLYPAPDIHKYLLHYIIGQFSITYYLQYDAV
jgi:hypothetical protein